MNEVCSTVPTSAAVRLAHAALQAIAEDAEVDILHIKGPALDEGLLEMLFVEDPETWNVVAETVPRRSMDADILVRPSQIETLLGVMAHYGWRTQIQQSADAGGLRQHDMSGRRAAAHFEDGSAFEHDAAFTHPFLQQADVHRSFPGIQLDPEEAFDQMWHARGTAVIAGYPCWVPSVPAQRLILILHAAREGATDHPDVDRAWHASSDDERRLVERLAVELHAEVALAAGTGRLGDHIGALGHDLWCLLAEGQYSLSSLWWARVRTEPTVWAGLRTGVRLVVPTPRRIAVRLGRAPTRRELVEAYVQQGRRGVVALADALQHARRSK